MNPKFRLCAWNSYNRVTRHIFVNVTLTESWSWKLQFFPQYESPDHYVLLLQVFINKVFFNRWTNHHAVVNWPLRHQTAQCAHYFWSAIKFQVYSRSEQIIRDIIRKGTKLQYKTHISPPGVIMSTQTLICIKAEYHLPCIQFWK